MCEHNHDSRDNATFYGGDRGHDFYRCHGCGETFSVVVDA